MSENIIISVENVTKYFPRHPQAMRKREKIDHFLSRRFLRKQKPEPFVALDSITFSIKEGESVGLVGSNGAGKSTLLRVITGITIPTSGNVSVRGRYGVQFSLNTGFNMKLSGRKNIYLYAALQNVSQEYIENKIDEIIEFAGLENFIDEPVQNYSSGMRSRLGFSLISHTAPDIIFIDEALGTGDAAFREKCDETLFRFLEEKKTLVIVSHSVAAHRKLCSRIIWLEQGKMKMDGPVDEVLGLYEEYQKERVRQRRRQKR